MSGFPTVHFGQSDSGLFSPEEIARLMESEYRRSLRYDFPLALLVVEIDRLESLHDLYGVESKQRIVRAVASLLHGSTRASDVFGTLRDQRMVVLLPHARREGALVIARRLLAGCRELEFRGEGRVLRASLSIGTAARTDEGELERLILRAEEALRAAVAGGGDRVVDHAQLPRSAASAEAPAAVAPAPVRRARTARAPAALPDVDALPGATLDEKVKNLLRLVGGGDVGGLEREVLAILQRTLQDSSRARTSRADVQEEIRALERRIADFKRMLDASEEELTRMIREKSLDPGVASVYRSVQGLDPLEKDYARKKELLAVIYRANVELLRELEREFGET